MSVKTYRCEACRGASETLHMRNSDGKWVCAHCIPAAELDAFRDALRAELGMPVVRRYSGGQDVHGGCGMLAGKLVGTRP